MTLLLNLLVTSTSVPPMYGVECLTLLTHSLARLHNAAYFTCKTRNLNSILISHICGQMLQNEVKKVLLV